MDLIAYCWHTPPRAANLLPAVWVRESDFSTRSNADQLANRIDRQPIGHRVVMLWQMLDDLLSDTLWPDEGIKRCEARLRRLFDEINTRGVTIDHVMLDFEQNFPNEMPAERRAKIVADPRFAGVAERLGFSDLSLMSWREGHDPWPYANKWAAVTGAMINSYLNLCVLDPLRRYFPNATVSNFASVVMDPKYLVPDPNGVSYPISAPIAGTHQTPVLYGSVGNLQNRTDINWNNPLNYLAMALNQLRSAMLSSQLPVMPWIGFRSWTSEGAQRIGLGNTPYHAELVYHAALSGVTKFLYFNPYGDGAASRTDDLLMDAALSTAQALPLADGKPALELIGWNADAIWTESANDRQSKARITFAPGVSEATVKIRGSTMRVARTGPVGRTLISN